MWPCWAAFAVHSLEIARSAAAPRPLCLLAPHESQASSFTYLYVGAVVSWPWDAVAYTSGPAMLGLRSAFSAKLVDTVGVCASQPLSDRNKGFVVIYIGGLHE